MQIKLTFDFLTLRSGEGKKGPYHILKGLYDNTETFTCFIEDPTPFRSLEPKTQVNAIFEVAAYSEKLQLFFKEVIKS